MKLIIAGDRNFTNYELLKEHVDEIEQHYLITEIVSGCCRGADKLGERYAEEYDIPIKRFPYITKLGRAGGPVRNKQMAEYVGEEGGLCAFLAEGSRGTKNMIETAQKIPLKMIWVCEV